MKITSLRAFALSAICAVALTFGAATSRAQDAPFFNGAQYVGVDANGFTVEYLSTFNEFTRDLFPYVYKYDFGYLYYSGADASNTSACYFYDYNSTHFFYTSTTLYPYFYDFSLNSFIYYFEGSSPRTFYDFKTSSYIAQ